MAAASTYVPIATQTLGSATASVTFSSIPATYTDLVLIVAAQNVTASGVNNMALVLNSDGGTNYSMTRLSGNGSTVSSDRASSATYAGWTRIDNTGSAFSTTFSYSKLFKHDNIQNNYWTGKF
jgi:hypothetical protein